RRQELGLPRDCSRLDVVGMGCNAGLNYAGATGDRDQLGTGRTPDPSRLRWPARVQRRHQSYESERRSDVLCGLSAPSRAGLHQRTDPRPASGPGPEPPARTGGAEAVGARRGLLRRPAPGTLPSMPVLLRVPDWRRALIAVTDGGDVTGFSGPAATL